MNCSHIRSVVRFATVPLIAGMGIAAIVGSGGGGGGDGDVAPPNTIESYFIGGPRFGVGPLSASAFGGAADVTFASNPPAMELPALQGTYDSATDDYVLDISTGPVVWLNVTGSTPPYDSMGNLEVSVSKTFRWRDELDPTEGEFTITSRNGSFAGKITATVTGSPAPGVNISYDSDNSGQPDVTQFYTWADFELLLENGTAPQYQLVAAFTYSMREFLYQHATIAREAFTMIEDGFASFEANAPGTPLPSPCSANSPAGGANQVQVAWHDNNSSGKIDLDDSFTLALDNCWFDDPTDDIDTLLNGQMELLHYDRALQGCPTYTNLRLDETNSAGAIPGLDIIVNGGFCIFLPGIGG